MAFIRLTRPVFLAGGALLYGLGVAMGEGSPGWGHYLVGQAMVTTIQLTAHYANEFFDLEADRELGAGRTWFSGGSGVLAAGELPPGVALRAAHITTGAAIAAIVAVATFSGWAAAAGAGALAGAWAYSAPPPRLVSTYFGVTAASAVVAVLLPITGALVAGPVPWSRIAPILASLFLLHHAMLIAFEKPDRPSDARAGKRTLSVRLGPTGSGALHGLLIAAAFAVLGIAVIFGGLEASRVAWTPALIPLAAWQAAAFSRSEDAVLTTGAIALFGLMVLSLLPGQA